MYLVSFGPSVHFSLYTPSPNQCFIVYIGYNIRNTIKEGGYNENGSKQCKQCVLCCLVIIFCIIVYMLRRFCSRTFSVRLRPSPSVPVCSPPFYHILSYYSVLLRPLLSHPCPCSLSVISVSSFQSSTLGSDPLVSSDLAFMLSLLLFGYNPFQPNPIVPRFLIIFCSYCLMISSPLLFRYV